MAQKIVLRTNVAVAGGPTLQFTQTMNVEVVTKCAVEVPGDVDDFVVNLQPSSSDHVELFVLTSTDYSGDVSYTVGDDYDADKAVKVDAPQVLMGVGATGLLDDDPTKLTFKNDASDPVAVDIVVGRQATGG